MALVTDGILTQKLPWGLVLIGVFLTIAIEIMGLQSLPIAVGVYLPISTSASMFAGGVVRWLVERRMRSSERSIAEVESGPGVLFSSGLIAGGAIAGIAIAGIAAALVNARGRGQGAGGGLPVACRRLADGAGRLRAERSRGPRRLRLPGLRALSGSQPVRCRPAGRSHRRSAPGSFTAAWCWASSCSAWSPGSSPSGARCRCRPCPTGGAVRRTLPGERRRCSAVRCSR